MIEHIDFHISYNCFNNCVFCSSKDAIKTFGDHPLAVEDILGLLRKKKRAGCGSVNFTGGEPTLFERFIFLVKETKKMGYRVYVGTAGGRFADTKFCRDSAGSINEICFSCHGHRPSLHNSMTGNKKSFARLESAMDNLSGFAVRFSSNTVVTASNIDFLDKILVFLIKKKIRQALFSNLAPEGGGLQHYNDLAVQLGSFRDKVPSLVKIADEAGLVIRFFGVPACVLGSQACRSNDFNWDPRLNIEQMKGKKVELTEEKCGSPTRGRIKTDKCRSCFYNGICGGVFRKYHEKFGDGEIEPFRA